MKIKEFPSTSTPEKIKIDLMIRQTISIPSDKFGIMLVGATDGLERHYHNFISWGGRLKNLIIIDRCESSIQNLIKFHNKFLSHYEMPTFIVDDLNDYLSRCKFGTIAVIDFDGTDCLSVYVLKTAELAKQLGVEFTIIVHPTRERLNEDFIKLGDFLPDVYRYKNVDKPTQIAQRGYYVPGYKQAGWHRPAGSFILKEVLKKDLGMKRIFFNEYWGRSRMAASVYAIN